MRRYSRTHAHTQSYINWVSVSDDNAVVKPLTSVQTNELHFEHMERADRRVGVQARSVVHEILFAGGHICAASVAESSSLSFRQTV